MAEEREVAAQGVVENFPDHLRNMDNKRWLQMLVDSVNSPVVENINFPRFPADSLQTMFVGSANQDTLTEASVFYKFLKAAANKANRPVQKDSRFLDFGCGWGRFLRFFWKDVAIENLYGCDTNKMIVDTCHALNMPGQIDLISPTGQLPYPDNHFDTVMAYSVFTHLPEQIHLRWVRELARVTSEGGIFCATLEPRRFLDFIDTAADQATNAWHQKLAEHKPLLPELYKNFDAGKLVFMPTNEGMEEVYGDAVVPLSFIRENWSPYFKVVDYVDDPKKFWQAVLVVQRTDQPVE